MSLTLTRPAPSDMPALPVPKPRLAALLPLLLGVPVMWLLHRYGASFGDLSLFLAYVIGLVAVPGVLLWRAVRRGGRSLAEDIGPGLAFGYVVEVLAYLAARAAGQPRLVLLAPVAVLVLFAAVRPLRRFWRMEPGVERAPLAWIWANTVLGAVLLAWAAVYFMRTRGVDYPFNDADLPFQLALIGELRHHLPPSVPWLRGESLNYHWFSYADLAATSWTTGIAPATLLLRLFFVPLLAVTPFVVASLARQVTGRWWPGPVAALLTFAGVAPYPYGWPMPETYTANGLGPVDDAVVLRFGLFSSPTQTFAALVAIALVMLMIDLLRGEWTWRTLVGLGASVAVICGAKATYLPIIICGLLLAAGLAVLGKVVAQRGFSPPDGAPGYHFKPALIGLAFAVPGVLFAQFVLFGGESQGMVLDPLGGLSRYGLAAATELGTFTFGQMPATGRTLVVITAVTLLSWVVMWGGAATLAVRGRWRDPAVQLLLGMGIAGIAAVLLLNHYGVSQTWFLVAARPYLAVAAVAGLAALTPRRPAWLAVPVIAGVALAWVVPRLGPAVAPTVSDDGRREVFLQIGYALSWLLIPVLIVAVAARRFTVLRGWAVAMLAGISLFPSSTVVGDHVRAAADARFEPQPQLEPLWPAGTREAAAWLRTHSDPDDLIATNGHCRRKIRTGCDNLHFWFAAFSERRFLLEGWGYTSTANRIQSETGMRGNLVPYWNQALLAENDAAFHQPSPATIDRLRTGHQVRWLFVDLRDPAVRADQLDRYTTPRFRSGSVAIYQLL